MSVILTDFQYSNDREGPWKLYIYESDGEHHDGGVWFEDHPKYPEEGEITTREATTRTITAVANGREVRVCDVGDMLVFHFDGQSVKHGHNFWNEVCP